MCDRRARPRVWSALVRRAACTVAVLFLGLRKGEVLGLCWEDVEITRQLQPLTCVGVAGFEPTTSPS